MPLTTLASQAIDHLYAFIYGEEGVGKTRLAMTLARPPPGKPRLPPNMSGVGIITIEENGPLSLLSAGYPKSTRIWKLHRSDDAGEIKDEAVYAIQKLAARPEIHAVVLDGTSMLQQDMCLAIGGGEKIDWDGWAKVLGNLQLIEREARKVVKGGKSFVWTAWETPPMVNEKSIQTDEEGNTPDEIIRGGPYIQGKGKIFVPGNVDILARMTSSVVIKDGKEVFRGKLQVKGDKFWKCKTRWNLPMYCKPDLQWVLDQVNGQAGLLKK